MYPHTRFDIIDQSHIPKIETPEPYLPLFMCGFTSDKGPEDFKVIDKNFEKIYGPLSFIKHGQPQLQAARILQNGGKIMAKRVVASDSTLANIVIVAKTKVTQIQKKDKDGNLLYLDGNGEETTEDDNTTPIMIDQITLKYEVVSIANAKSIAEVNTGVGLIESEDEDGFTTFPLFIITDNGRGKSNKKIRIYPNYEASKPANFLRYQIEIIENNSVIESSSFSLDPELIYLDVSFSLETIIKNKSEQIKCKVFNDNTFNFNKEIAEVTGIENMLLNDVFAGRMLSGEIVENLLIDDDSANLTITYGIPLENGGNGSFGDMPFDAESYENEMVKVFDGTYDEIYDQLRYPVEIILDANYPSDVKEAIENLCTFREDIFFIGDMGTDLTVMEQFKNVLYNTTRSKFCSYSGLWYDAINPITRKHMSVTYCYSMAKLLPDHLLNGRNRPLAGILHNIILDDAIEGTVNFTPKVTPSLNQKQEMCDMRINYASWINNRLVMETQYTTQKPHTQLSYINNVLAIQEVIRAVRNRCPATRYSFIDGNDLEIYKNDVQSVLNKYIDNFDELTFVYIEDEVMVLNKIFYAAISVKCRNYVQAEHFKLYVII